jgi:hypothetical protein
MRGKRTVGTMAILAAAVGVLMVLGAFQAGGILVGSRSSGAGGPSMPATASRSSSTVSVELSPASGASNFARATPGADGPHPGTLQVYEPVPGGASTEDPAAAYDVTSYEPILNVDQTLVSYNGSTTATFVPTLATCVPLQGTQCATDYGAGFTGVFNATGANFTGANGQPVYWTFVLDPAAHFYDPATRASWPVYPSDVMFSIARTLAWSTYPVATKTAGWILAQSLLPLGSAKWDGGIHSPYNNTPALSLGSMLVNNTTFCPPSAMNGVKGNGCITFVANGTGQVWPEFLDFVEDNLGASIVPCGWYTYESAGIPGWAGTAATKGDGSCLLPNGKNNTGGNWTTYLSGLAPKAWDTFIKLNINWPAPQPNVQWSMVGSGPYYASVTKGLSYALAASPAYKEPSGCSGAGGLAVYTGYCDPAPGAYIPNVDVTWETSAEGDSLGTDAIEAGTADFAGIYTTETSTLLGYVHSGLWQYVDFPTLSDGFTTINLGVDYSAYNTTFSGEPLEANPIPPTLFTSIGLRNFYDAAYPYTTIQDTINTVDGIQFSFNAGGPIPVNMGNYYPSNVSWPYLLGDPTQSASTVGSAAWWWAQLTNPSSPYYNATIATKCTSSNPCTWPIGYFDGAPADLTLINDWAGEVSRISGHAMEPWPLAMTFAQFLAALVGAYESPLVSVVGFGWAPDYPDPTDYIAPIVQPNGDYTGPDTVSQQLLLPAHEDNASCGHSGLANLSDAYANLSYWANVSQHPANGNLSDACQGVAYNVASYWMGVAGKLAAGPQRVLDYNLIEQITNALGLYVWNGQTNELIGFAPWILPSSVNTNPVIGGGGDLIWFHLQYRSVYTTTISETGLPAGTKWSATVGGGALSSTGSSIAFAPQPNGTYNFTVSYAPGYTVSPANGTITINGVNPTKSVTYSPLSAETKTTKVYFNETGLVTGTSWTLLVTGYGAQTSSSPTLVFTLPQSTTYPYTPLAVLGYVTAAPGNVVVGATAANATVAYRGLFGATYEVTFSQVGLPAGVSWSTTVGVPTSPVTLSSSGSTIVFFEENGTTNFTVNAPSGYAVGPGSGSVLVNGDNRTVSLAFVKIPTPAWDSLSTLAYALIGLLAVLALIGFALAARYRRRGQPAKAPATWTGEPAPPATGGEGTSPSLGGGPPKT